MLRSLSAIVDGGQPVAAEKGQQVQLGRPLEGDVLEPLALVERLALDGPDGSRYHYVAHGGFRKALRRDPADLVRIPVQLQTLRDVHRLVLTLVRRQDGAGMGQPELQGAGYEALPGAAEGADLLHLLHGDGDPLVEHPVLGVHLVLHPPELGAFAANHGHRDVVHGGCVGAGYEAVHEPSPLVSPVEGEAGGRAAEADVAVDRAEGVGDAV
jgi:hypothetical protein